MLITSNYRRVTQRHSELVDRHIVLNCPHGRGTRVLISSPRLSISICRVFKKYLENSWTQLKRSWVSKQFFGEINSELPPLSLQFIFFQIPRLPEALLSLQDYQFLEQLFTSNTSVHIYYYTSCTTLYSVLIGSHSTKSFLGQF